MILTEMQELGGMHAASETPQNPAPGSPTHDVDDQSMEHEEGELAAEMQPDPDGPVTMRQLQAAWAANLVQAPQAPEMPTTHDHPLPSAEQPAAGEHTFAHIASKFQATESRHFQAKEVRHMRTGKTSSLT